MTTLTACAGLEPNKPPEDDNRMLKIKKLKARLINEEHRLVLMKKIRQSQTRPAQPQAVNSTTGSSNVANQLQGAGPNKKFRSAQSGPLALQKNHQSSSSSSVQSGSSLNQTPAHAHQRPKVNTLWNPPQQARHPTPVGIAPPHVGNLSRQPITTPPNVVQAMMSNLTGQQSLLMNQINAVANARRPQQQQQQQQQLPLQTSYNKSQAAQMLMQKSRPSFKASIQKQLEQTILQQQQQQHQQPLKLGQQSALGFPSNLNKGRSVGITSPHVGNLSRQPITTPPNVVQDMRGGLSGQQSLLMNVNNLSSRSRPQAQQSSSSSTSTPSSSSSFNKSQSAQMLITKRTAAKAAIRKQLEQTLMQLPQKHVQVGIDFLPNANNIEFVYYVGLEACVDYLTNSKYSLDTQPLEKPFECSTCGTDFTPAWSWKRSNAVCENCVSNHVKKSIKNSQASRIKMVLSKAIKQEQDMDQRIMAEAANVVSSATPTTSSQKHSLLQPASHQQHQQLQQQRSASQMWPRVNASSPMNVVNNNNRSTNVQPTINPPAPNPLANLQPAALASLLQMNPQLSTLASLMTANNSNNNNNNSTNQFAQVAALLMNQLTMNLWKR